jgi:hypothetical protein
MLFVIYTYYLIFNRTSNFRVSRLKRLERERNDPSGTFKNLFMRICMQIRPELFFKTNGKLGIKEAGTQNLIQTLTFCLNHPYCTFTDASLSLKRNFGQKMIISFVFPKYAFRMHRLS